MIVRCTKCHQEEHTKIGFVCHGNDWFCPLCWMQNEIKMEVIQ